jgi:hypothetical protein
MEEYINICFDTTLHKKEPGMFRTPLLTDFEKYYFLTLTLLLPQFLYVKYFL